MPEVAVGACCRGCTIRGRHLNTCRVEDHETEAWVEVSPTDQYLDELLAPPTEDEPLLPRNPAVAGMAIGERGLIQRIHCTGCKPRRAEHELVCATCHRRLQDWLDGEHGLVWVYGWMGENLPIGGSSHQQEWSKPAKVSGSPAPLKVALAAHRILLLDRAFEVDTAARDLFDRPANDRPFDLADTCRFLLAWLTKIEQDASFVGYVYEQFEEVMRDAAVMVPWRDRPRRVHGIMCPSCELMSLAVYGGDEDVTCLSCRSVIPKERYEIWTRILADQAMQQEAS